MADVGMEATARSIVLYILPAKIQNKRLEDMRNAAIKRGHNVSDRFSPEVTHIITEHTNTEAVARSLKIDNTTGLDHVIVLNMSWFNDSLKAGKLVEVESKYCVASSVSERDQDDGQNKKKKPSGFNMPEYACQRATPLDHSNKKFTDALEVLEKHAELTNGEHDYSRALAFRRASCVLKCLPVTITNMYQLRNLTNIGDHNLRVIQDILEDGESQEVENIREDPWFHKMKLFSSVFGIGEATAKKWIEKGWTSIEDARSGSTKSDWRVIWGLAFHYDLVLPVAKEETSIILEIIRTELEAVSPGAIMELTGGFRRGKWSGHDVDILITHPTEGKENGILPRLLQRLQHRDVILCGKHEKSTFTKEVLYKDFKLSQKGQLDHFEKWLGIIKVQKCEETEHSCLCNKSETVHKHVCGQCDASLNKSAARLTDGVSNINQSPVEPEHCSQSLPESLDDFQPKAKRQRVGQDSELTPLELAAGERDWRARRLDLIISPFSQFYYALVGWTGNKQFNRDLRWYATKELGLKLTSHGLYELKEKCSIPANSERQVFDHLKIPYREPWERNC